MNSRLTNSILVVLLVLNLAFIGTWWVTHARLHNRFTHEEGLRGKMQDRGMLFLTRQLGFDDNQRAKAEKIFHDHAGKIQKVQADITRLQKEIFTCLMQDTPDSMKAFTCCDSVGIFRTAMQKEFLRSSMAIRQICTERQKKKCDELMQKIAGRINHRRDDMGNGAPYRDSL